MPYEDHFLIPLFYVILFIWKQLNKVGRDFGEHRLRLILMCSLAERNDDDW